MWRDHCQNKLEGSCALQRVQKVFISAFSSYFYKEKVTRILWWQKQSPLPLGGDLAGQVQQSAWLQFGLQTAHLNQHLHFHTLHWPTFTLMLMQPGIEPKDLVAYRNFPFFPLPKCFEKYRVRKSGWTKRKPTVSRRDTCSNTSEDSTVCPHMMPYEVKGGGRNQCCCCCLHCDCSRCKQGPSGVSPWQLSTVLKFTPKELGQWKFLREKRTEENSWLDLIDMKSLQYNNRWTVELLWKKCGKEVNLALFQSGCSYQLILCATTPSQSIHNFLAGQSGLKICYANEVGTSD